MAKQRAALRRGRGPRRKGAYAVEMAAILPVLFFTVFAGLELIHAFQARHALNQISYEAARKVIIPGARSEDARLVAERIAKSHKLEIVSFAMVPETVSDETKEVTISVSAKLRGGIGFSKLLLPNVLQSSCTLVHENRTIFKF